MPQAVEYAWSVVGHVDPPEKLDDDDRQLLYYLGPNHYPAGLYLPRGYELETREGDEGWTVNRARCSLTGQILTIWCIDPDGKPAILEP
jgi:hypothetical protein